MDGQLLDDDFKKKLTGNPDSLELSTDNRLILNFAIKTTREAHAVDQAYIDALKEHGFSEPLIHDVVFVAAYFNFINRLADGLGVELEG